MCTLCEVQLVREVQLLFDFQPSRVQEATSGYVPLHPHAFHRSMLVSIRYSPRAQQDLPREGPFPGDHASRDTVLRFYDLLQAEVNISGGRRISKWRRNEKEFRQRKPPLKGRTNSGTRGGGTDHFCAHAPTITPQTPPSSVSLGTPSTPYPPPHAEVGE
jgi:hypothetical protein